MSWETVAFIAIVVAGHATYTTAVFLVGLSIGIARGHDKAFRQGWDAASANQVDQARVASLD
jgi:hypothetical protein